MAKAKKPAKSKTRKKGDAIIVRPTLAKVSTPVQSTEPLQAWQRGESIPCAKNETE